MSGIFESTTAVAASGDTRIDGILHSIAWQDDGITYSLPATEHIFGSQYGGGEADGFFPASPQMTAALIRYLDVQNGNPADDGFALEGFTNLTVEPGTAIGSTIRLSQTSADPFGFGTAWAYFPGTLEVSGDFWMYDGNYNYANPLPGNYAHHTLMHELGHTLGLAHGHENTAFGQLPGDLDVMEFTVMTYRSYPGSLGQVYNNGSTSYAHSFMMLDIAALQYLYGANYTVNSDDTVYSWRPGFGTTFVNGENAFQTAGDRIFATVWDGGGIDTYDLSAFEEGLSIDLSAGGHSVFSSAQLAWLGGGFYARGNIYNALLHENDPRSFIENAIGGSGEDEITGNRVHNRLEGGDASDSLFGRIGDDRLFGQKGQDALRGGKDADSLFGGLGDDWLGGGRGDDSLNGGWGDDTLVGGPGQDCLIGGLGADVFVFRDVMDSPVGAGVDVIEDFEQGQDRIDLTQLSAGEMTFEGDDDFDDDGPSVIFETGAEMTRIFVDVDGDEIADMQIDLVGVFDLEATDFIF